MSLPSASTLEHILTRPDRRFTHRLVEEARRLTEQFFGRTISLYAPLYLSNYCSSVCTYCGFSRNHRIERRRLSFDQREAEMKSIAATGIESILLLTGESYKATPLSYLTEAVAQARRYFPHIALEIHPLETEDYQILAGQGVDGIAVYQETYDRVRYREVHLAGQKADYDFRLGTPERAARAGIRQIALGVLLGLSDPARDVAALYQHLRWMEKEFPGVEYSVSFPRLKTIKGRALALCRLSDETFIRILALTRILFPRVGINLSTRERPDLRDQLLGVGVTRLSAGSRTSVGGYSLLPEEKQEPQFDIEDTRPVDEIVHLLRKKQFDPVFTEWRSLV